MFLVVKKMDSFVEAGVPDDETGGPVDVSDSSSPAACLLWEEVGPIINSVSNQMKAVLMSLGVDDDTIFPFCRQFQSLEELTST